MSELELPRLADNRSTQRLVNLLYKLEEQLANAAAVGSANAKAQASAMPIGGQINGEISRLRQENKHLRKRQRAATDRLDDLMLRMQSQLEGAEATAMPIQQEQAA